MHPEPLGIDADPAAATDPDAFPNRRALITYHMEALEELADPVSRADGWTPFARKLFLQVLAETGRVTLACETCCLSKQSAYALRARDSIFAAGWDAACELARMPLADALYEQALDGLTDTITRDDGTTITRHRFDSRLSIAVLNRLDRRCDRAAEQGSRHLGAVRQWDQFTAAIGNDEQAEAAAILDPPAPSGDEDVKQGQPSQLPEVPKKRERVWWDRESGEWRTNFPPPPCFDGLLIHTEWLYERTLTADELELVEREAAIEEEAENAEDEAERDAYFAKLGDRLDEATPKPRHPTA